MAVDYMYMAIFLTLILENNISIPPSPPPSPIPKFLSLDLSLLKATTITTWGITSYNDNLNINLQSLLITTNHKNTT